MHLELLDWLIIISYLIFAVGIGIYFTKRASTNTEEYFLSGRTLPWWIVGTSMVATTFAADTPLAITEWIRGPGIWQNWFWWNELMIFLLGAFLFSRLWRRAEVLTDNELLEVRYSGKPAAFLRGFKAIYFSILYNFIVMGWVINAMAAVMAVMLDIDRWYAVWTCVVIALIYALLSGFWGVVITDLVQFGIAMFGSIFLAIVAVSEMGGMTSLINELERFAGVHENITNEISIVQNEVSVTTDSVRMNELSIQIDILKEKLKRTPRVTEHTLSFIPPVPDAGFFTMDFWNSPFSRFLVFMLILWWSTHKTDGGGYIIQRMSSAKNEKHALLGTLWFNLMHYAFRIWPWIVVAMVSIVAFPDVSGLELGDKAGYPLVMREFLGTGMKGVLIVTFLAAFMSTIDTHLNWGASYLINDIYKRFLKPENSFYDSETAQRHYVFVGKIITVFLMIFAALTALKMQSIVKAWEFIIALGAGVGLVLILRWFWWRINAWSEISAMSTSVLITIILEIIAAFQTSQAGEYYTLFGRSPVVFGVPLMIHHKLLIIVPTAVVVWLTVTFATAPVDKEKLIAFYKRVQPGGWWKPIAADIPRTMPSVAKGIIGNWFAGLAFIWGILFSIGDFIFGNWGRGMVLICLALAGFTWIWKKSITKID